MATSKKVTPPGTGREMVIQGQKLAKQKSLERQILALEYDIVMQIRQNILDVVDYKYGKIEFSINDKTPGLISGNPLPEMYERRDTYLLCERGGASFFNESPYSAYYWVNLWPFGAESESTIFHFCVYIYTQNQFRSLRRKCDPFLMVPEIMYQWMQKNCAELVKAMRPLFRDRKVTECERLLDGEPYSGELILEHRSPIVPFGEPIYYRVE